MKLFFMFGYFLTLVVAIGRGEVVVDVVGGRRACICVEE